MKICRGEDPNTSLDIAEYLPRIHEPRSNYGIFESDNQNIVLLKRK